MIAMANSMLPNDENDYIRRSNRQFASVLGFVGSRVNDGAKVRLTDEDN